MLSSGGALGSTLIAGIASILIARTLGVTNRGRWAVISSLAVLVGTLGATGLPIAAAYGAARLRGSERQRLIQAAGAAAVGLSALAAVVYLVLAAILALPAPTPAVAVGATVPIATILYAVAHQLTLTVSTMRSFALIQLANAAATLVAVVVLDAAGALTVLAVVVVSAGGASVGAATSFVALRRSDAIGPRPWVWRPRAISPVLRPYLAYSLLTFATLSLTQVVQRVDVLLLGGYRGPHAAGLYAVAVQVTDLMLVVPGALGLAMFRRGARASPSHYRRRRDRPAIHGNVRCRGSGACVPAGRLGSSRSCSGLATGVASRRSVYSCPALSPSHCRACSPSTWPAAAARGSF